mmetsp:Transcript_13987/g.39495  ORF Transcript_13987/g.39495 Transcript_13987/m.39495 type:complete len:479 (-) Transcript_13987:488-1924(-)
MALVSQLKGEEEEDLQPLKKKLRTNGVGTKDGGCPGEGERTNGDSRAGTNSEASPSIVKAEASDAVREVKPETPSAPSPLQYRQVNGAYTEREAWLTKQELEGDIRFECIRYDDRKEGNTTHLEWLLALKNIFSRQLPNMPKEYIARLVFDKHHRSMVALKKDKVFGGCTFRCFENQEFGEIVFLAIAAQEQVRGYGTRLMNHLKEFAKREEKLTHFLTYADNNAIGYFQKQGFTREIFLEREKWGGFIKDYDGGTLMECALNFQLSYTQFSKIIKQQRDFLDSQVKKISRSHIVYPGLQFFKDLKPGEYKRADIAGIPGVNEALELKKKETDSSDSAPVGSEEEQRAASLGLTKAKFQLVTPAGLVTPSMPSLHSFMTRVHAAVVDHADSWPFKEPVDPLEVPDYHDVIKDPVDLSLVARRICSYEYYIKLEIFVADFKMMFTNARMYNSPDTIYYKCANRLESFFDDQIRSGISFT